MSCKYLLQLCCLTVFIIALFGLISCGDDSNSTIVTIKDGRPVASITESDLASRLKQELGPGNKPEQSSYQSCVSQMRQTAETEQVKKSCSEQQQVIQLAVLERLIQQAWLLNQAKLDLWEPSASQQQLIAAEAEQKQDQLKATFFLNYLSDNEQPDVAINQRFLRETYQRQRDLFTRPARRKAIVWQTDKSEIANRISRLLSEGTSVSQIDRQIRPTSPSSTSRRVTVEVPQTSPNGPGSLLSRQDKAILAAGAEGPVTPIKLGANYLIVKVISDQQAKAQIFAAARGRVKRLIESDSRRQQAIVKLAKSWRPRTSCQGDFRRSRLCANYLNR